MSGTFLGTLILPAVLLSAAAAPIAAAADTAPPRAVVCLTAPTGSLAGPAPARPAPQPLPALTLATIRPTTGAGAPATALPTVALMPPQPQTGAYVLPTQTAMPSLRGATVPAPQVLIPPVPVPGEDRAVVATGLVQSAVDPSAAHTMCY